MESEDALSILVGNELLPMCGGNCSLNLFPAQVHAIIHQQSQSITGSQGVTPSWPTTTHLSPS